MMTREQIIQRNPQVTLRLPSDGGLTSMLLFLMLFP